MYLDRLDFVLLDSDEQLAKMYDSRVDLKEDRKQVKTGVREL